MTDDAALIARLRAIDYTAPHDDLCHEAAERIAALTQRIADISAGNHQILLANQEVNDRATKAAARLAALTRGAELYTEASSAATLQWEQRAKDAEARIAALTAELEASFTEQEFRSMQRVAERAEAEAKENAQDAERYRYMRDEHSDLSFMFTLSEAGKPLGIMAREKLDATIDAALAGGSR